MVNGQPKRLLATSERVVYKFRSDNMIFHYGSGGASNFGYAIFKYNGNSFDTIKRIDTYDGNFTLTSENGVTQPISEAQFWQLAAEFESPVIRFSVTPIK